MAIVARGHVRDRPFARTVYAIAAKRFSGDMIMTDSGRSYTLTWQDGAVIAAKSASPADSPARVALTAGLVNTTQVAEIMRRVTESPGGDPLAVLAEVARLTPEQLVRVKRRALAQCAMRIFALPEASFVLDSAPGAGPDGDIAPIGVRWLIYQGLCAHYDEDRLAGELAAVEGASFRLLGAAKSVLGQYGFEAAAREALGELERVAMTAEELAVAAPALGRKGTLAVIYALLATDALAADMPEGARPARAPSRAGSEGAPRAPSRAGSEGAPTARAPSRPGSEGAPRAPSRAGSEGHAQPSRPAGRARASTAGDAAGASASRAVKVTAGKGGAAQSPVDPGRVAEMRELITGKLADLDAGADYYKILGISRDCAASELRAAYFDLAKKLHPDRLRASGITDNAADAQRLFAYINKGFSVLSNTKKRAEYDASLAKGGASDDDAGSVAARLIAAEQHFVRGQTALRHNRVAAAVTDLEKAVELNPDEAEHHAYLAWARWCATSDKSAVIDEVKQGLARAITLSPKCVSAHFYRGQVMSNRGDLQRALESFRKVLEIDPKHHDAGLQVRLIEGRLEKEKEKGEKKGLLDRLKRK